MTATKRKQKPRRASLAGQGFELTAAIVGFAAIGYWIGGYYGDPRKGLLIGGVLGIVGGLYNLIRAALREFKRQEESSQQEKNS